MNNKYSRQQRNFSVYMLLAVIACMLTGPESACACKRVKSSPRRRTVICSYHVDAAEEPAPPNAVSTSANHPAAAPDVSFVSAPPAENGGSRTTPQNFQRKGDGVSVTDFGAIGDGVADDASAFIQAIAAAKSGQGVVRVPHGEYKLRSPIAIENALLLGLVHGDWPADSNIAPVLIVAHNQGPAFTLLQGASIHGFKIQHEGDAHPDAPNRHTTLLLTCPGSSVCNLKIEGAWKGIICASPAPNPPPMPNSNPGRLYIANVFLVGPRECGIDLENTRDASLIENCEVWAPNIDGKIGFRFGGNDHIRCSKLFAFGCKVGFQLYASDDGVSFWGDLNECGSDLCEIGLDIKAAYLLSITGGTHMSHWNCLHIDAPTSNITIAGGLYKSNGAPAGMIENTGQLSITGATFLRGQDHDPALLELAGGDAISVTGCSFDCRAACSAVRVHEDRVLAATLCGNAFSMYPRLDGSVRPAVVFDVPEVVDLLDGQELPREFNFNTAVNSPHDNIQRVGNVGSVVLPRPAMMPADQLHVSTNRLAQRLGYASAIPLFWQNDGMVEMNVYAIKKWAADVKDASWEELASQLTGTPFDLTTAEGRVFASNRWARSQVDATGTAYGAGWPNYEQLEKFGVICIKQAYVKDDVTNYPETNFEGIVSNIAKQADQGNLEAAKRRVLPNFEIGADGLRGIFIISKDVCEIRGVQLRALERMKP